MTGDTGLRGVIRLAAPSDLGRHALLDWLEAFSERYPGADIRLQLSDRRASLHDEHVDAALRYGAGTARCRVRDASLVPRQSSRALRGPGVPGAPRHARHASRSRRARCPVRHAGRRGHRSLALRAAWPRVAPVRGGCHEPSCDQRQRCPAQMGVQGRGIAYLSAIDVAQDVALRHLTVLCTQWNTEPWPLSLVVPDRRPLSPLMEAFTHSSPSASRRCRSSRSRIPRGRARAAGAAGEPWGETRAMTAIVSQSASLARADTIETRSVRRDARGWASSPASAPIEGGFMFTTPRASFATASRCSRARRRRCSHPAWRTRSRIPSKPVRIIVPYTPGGSNDVLGRMVAKHMQDSAEAAFRGREQAGRGRADRRRGRRQVAAGRLHAARGAQRRHDGDAELQSQRSLRSGQRLRADRHAGRRAHRAGRQRVVALHSR